MDRSNIIRTRVGVAAGALLIRFRLFAWCSLLFFYSGANPASAQVLKDSVLLHQLGKGIYYAYNMRFDKAEEICNRIGSQYPGQAVVFIFRGMITYWENYPLISSSPARSSFEYDMRKCIELSEKKHKTPDEAEYLLTNLCARGFLLLFYADNELSGDVLPLASSTYKYIRRAFDFPSVYSDFLFFTGIYNYYREAYPDAHPIYKALAFLFPKGNKARGLMELQKAADNSIFLKAESNSFLEEISVSYENDYQKASEYSSTLHKLYPSNIQYLADYIKNLLLIKRYDDAERLILDTHDTIKNAYFQAQLRIFRGLIQEKKYHDADKASQYYLQGIKEISGFGKYANDYLSYAYFGLSRISKAEGDKHNRKYYRKKAIELATFKKINFDE